MNLKSISERKFSPNGLRNKLGRLAWAIVQSTAFGLSPRPCHRWRVWLLRCFGAKVSYSSHVYPRALIWAPWNLTVGDIVGIADGAVIYNQDKIFLEDYVVISQEAFLCSASHDYHLLEMPLWSAPITIKKGAWVAARAFIHPGITIGERAVVGACAVVTRDVQAYHIVAGNPAQTVKINETKN